jgi:ribonuclease HI
MGKNAKLGQLFKALREFNGLGIMDVSLKTGFDLEKIEKLEEGYLMRKTALRKLFTLYGFRPTRENALYNSIFNDNTVEIVEAKDDPRPTIEALAKEGNHSWKLYSDGGCRPNPGKGAWAYVILCDGIEAERNSGYVASTTNNEMELIGMINGLKRLIDLDIKSVESFSDSTYVVNGLNAWVENWLKDDEKLTNRKNGTLWFELWDLKKRFKRFSLQWCKGHNGNQWNELCDAEVNRELDLRGAVPEYYRPYKTYQR